MPKSKLETKYPGIFTTLVFIHSTKFKLLTLTFSAKLICILYFMQSQEDKSVTKIHSKENPWIETNNFNFAQKELCRSVSSGGRQSHLSHCYPNILWIFNKLHVVFSERLFVLCYFSFFIYIFLKLKCHITQL